MHITPEVALERFKQLGLEDAADYLDSYTQTGIFGDLEAGKITDEEFRQQLSGLVGRELEWAECQHAWLGYRGEVPRLGLQTIQLLRQQGYRVVLTSNTNPFMMDWAEHGDFDGQGHSIAHYFDALYCSYRLRSMKPDTEFFLRILQNEQVSPETVLFIDDGPRNVAAASQMGIRTLLAEPGKDWTKEIGGLLD